MNLQSVKPVSAENKTNKMSLNCSVNIEPAICNGHLSQPMGMAKGGELNAGGGGGGGSVKRYV